MVSWAWNALSVGLCMSLLAGCLVGGSPERSNLEGELGVPLLEDFQTDVFSGNASVRVPFGTPSGVGGFGPTLGLVYSSMRGADEVAERGR